MTFPSMTSTAMHEVYLMGMPTSAAAVGSGTAGGGDLDFGLSLDRRPPTEGEDFIDSLLDSFKVPEDGFVDKFLER